LPKFYYEYAVKIKSEWTTFVLYDEVI
jgi:hypothetical protein